MAAKDRVVLQYWYRKTLAIFRAVRLTAIFSTLNVFQFSTCIMLSTQRNLLTYVLAYLLCDQSVNHFICFKVQIKHLIKPEHQGTKIAVHWHPKAQTPLVRFVTICCGLAVPLQTFQTAKVTFSLTQGYWQSCHSIGQT